MKKLICVITVTLLALMLTGCNNASGISTTPAPTKPAATTPVQTTPVPTTPPTTPAPTEPTTAEPVDEIALLRTTFEIAEKDQGVFLVRDDKIYTLNDDTSKVPGVDYSNLLPWRDGLKEITFYFGLRTMSNFFSSMGDVPIPVLTEGDKIIAFSNIFFDLELAPANFIGFSFFLRKSEDYYWGYDKNNSRFSVSVKNEITITDEKGNIVKDYSSLEKDGVYTLSWYEGTKYNEVKLVANCIQFDYDFEHLKDTYTVSGTLTKDGYAEYDLSSIPVGLYVIKSDGRYEWGCGLIEIKK